MDIALGNDECVKINTGAAVPTHADAIIQVEDTKLVSSEGDVEKTVEILTKPVKGVDIRQIGSDLSAGSRVFNAQTYPGLVSYKSLLAGVGVAPKVISIKHGQVQLSPILTNIYTSSLLRTMTLQFASFQRAMN